MMIKRRSIDRKARFAARAAAAVVGFASIMPAVTVAAQDRSPSKENLERIRKEIEHTMREINTLEQEVDRLRAASDNWMTDERASEIRALVSDVIADADTRASLLQDDITAGWDQNFFLSAADGSFLMLIDGLAQIRWVFNYMDSFDEYRQGFENTRTRLTFRGHVFNPDLTYLVRMDISRNEPDPLVPGLFFLTDAWIGYRLDDHWSLRFGQMKLPFNREELVNPAYQLPVERSLVNESYNLGRSQGIELRWANDNLRLAAMTGDGAADNVGGLNIITPGGNPLNTAALAADVEWTATGRAEWKLAGTWEQFEDFTSPPDSPFGLLLGVAGHVQEGEELGNEEEWFAVTTDVSVELDGANFFGALVYHYIDSPGFASTAGDFEGYGAVAQAGYYLTEKFELFGRWEWGQLKTSARRSVDGRLEGIAWPTLHLLTVGFNYYFYPENRHASKLTTDVGISFDPLSGEVGSAFDSDIAGWRQDAEGADPQVVFRMQYQLLF